MGSYLICIALAAGAADDSSTVAALAAGVERRQAAYGNLEFVYMVTFEVTPPPEPMPGQEMHPTSGPVDSRDTFRVMVPQGRSSRRWRYWERRVDDGEGHWVLDRFLGFDGSQFRSFRRKEIEQMNSISDGLILPDEDWSTYSENPFDAFLLMDLNGVSEYVDPTRKVSRSMDREYKVIDRRKSEGREVYKLRADSTPDWPVVYNVEVTGEPDFIVMHWEAADAKDPNHLFALYEVETIGLARDVAYPASGQFHSEAAGMSPGQEYRFSIVSVEELPEKARQHWFPKWPKGTGVVDHVSSKQFTIPHDPAVLEKKVLEKYGAQQMQPRGMSGLSIFFIVLNGVAVVGFLVYWFVYRKG